VIQDPAGVRAFSIQRGSTSGDDYQWIIAYSYTGGIIGGSPSATVAPTSTNGQYIQGNIATGILSWYVLNATDGSYRNIICASNTSPYVFYMTGFSLGGGKTSTHAFMLDVMQSGSYDSGDLDPAVVYVGYNTSGASTTSPQVGVPFSVTNLATSLATGNGGPFAWQRRLSAFGQICALEYYLTTTLVVPDGLEVNPGGYDDVFPLLWARPYQSTATTLHGYKGTSTLLQWMGVQRYCGDTMSITTTRDHIVIGDVCLPWDGSVPLV
jgi:hypothetical protein